MNPLKEKLDQLNDMLDCSNTIVMQNEDPDRDMSNWVKMITYLAAARERLETIIHDEENDGHGIT